MSVFSYFCVFLAILPVIYVSGNLVSSHCFACICEAASNCKQDIGCNGDVCGPFQITPAFWKDAGELYSENSSEDKFSSCANDLKCASSSIENYMTKYQKDCNKDGKIDCDDFVLIHRYGASSCEKTLAPENLFLETYIKCKVALNL